MENLLNCPIQGCKNKAFVLYGSQWVCGECLLKLMEIEKQEKIERMEKLGNAD